MQSNIDLFRGACTPTDVNEISCTTCVTTVLNVDDTDEVVHKITEQDVLFWRLHIK